MRSFIISLTLCIGLLTQEALSQVPSAQEQFFSAPIVFSGTRAQIDFVANQTGMHFLYDSATTIVHSLIGHNGSLLHRSIVVNGLSAAPVISMASAKIGVAEHLFCVYRIEDTLKILRSTDAGQTWNTETNNSVSSNTTLPSGRISAIAEEQSVHVVWDGIREDNLDTTRASVHYRRYNLNANPPNWSHYRLVTDGQSPGDTVRVTSGDYPDIVLSKKNGTTRIHVVFIHERVIDNPCRVFLEPTLLFQQIVERTAIVTSSSVNWEPIDKMFETIENPCDNANAHGLSKTTMPMAFSSEDSLFVAFGSLNYNAVGYPNPVYIYLNYETLLCKPADYRRANTPDVMLNDVINKTEMSTTHSAVHSDISRVARWISYKNQSTSVCISRIDPITPPSTSYINLEYGISTFTCASANYANACIVAWYAGRIQAYRIPAYLNNDINVHTNITSIAQVQPGNNLSVGAGVLVTVYGTLVLSDSSSLTMQPGSRLVLTNPKARVYCMPGSSLRLNDATIVCADAPDSALIMYEPHALRGTGSIEGSGTILWKTRIRTEWDDTLTFRKGMTFVIDSLVTDSSCRWENYGSMRFTGPYEYAFAGRLDTILNGGGSWEVCDSTTLWSIPHFINWSGAVLRAEGRTDSCRLRFATARNLDNYGHLFAKKTCFEGLSRDTAAMWNGILSAYNDAVIALDSCYIRDIRVISDIGGSAIHLYDAGDTANVVQCTKIERPMSPYYAAEGDAIFLQGNGNSSSLKVICSNISNYWWTGISNVASSLDIASTVITGNRVGIGLSSTYYFPMLVDNCIEYHSTAGLFLNNSVARLGTPMGTYYPWGQRNGSNRIADNDTTQILLRGQSFLCGGLNSSPAYGGNNISHTSDAVKRVVLDTNSVAILTDNWWGEADTYSSPCTLTPDMVGRFFTSPSAGSIIYDPVQCGAILEVCTQVCEGLLPVVFTKSPALPPYASNLYQLPRYAASGNMDEVYRFIGSIFAGNPSALNASRALTLLLAIETDYGRSSVDTAQACFGRITTFLDVIERNSTNNGVKAHILTTKARATHMFGYPSQARTAIQQLRSSHAGSVAAKEIVPVMLLTACAERDSSTINAALSEIATSGYTDMDIHQAYGIKRGYDRVLPRSVFPKNTAMRDAAAERNVPSGRLSLRSYPNPFGVSTMIEYTLQEEAQVDLKIYNIHGELVGSLVDGLRPRGIHAAAFSAGNRPSGLYVAVLKVNSVVTKTLMLHVK